MDNIRSRTLGGQPGDLLHRIASIVPGYEGYTDREKRRDADKIFRMQLARRYSAQRDRLNRVEQGLLRARQMSSIGEIDRLAGLLQRFIDKLSTATYGYSGLFDSIRVEAQDLDQLYAFDLSLAGGVDQLSGAIDALESAASAGGQYAELPAALTRLETVLDDLNRRLNQRADLLTSGTALPESDYRALVSSNNQPAPTGQTAGSNPTNDTGTPTTAVGGPDIQSPQGYGSPPNQEIGAATFPGTNVDLEAEQAPGPGLSAMNEGDQGFVGQPTEVTMGDKGPGEAPLGGAGGTGIQTASSPSVAPGAPGHDIVDGLEKATQMGSPVPDSGEPTIQPTPAPNGPGAKGPLGNDAQS